MSDTHDHIENIEAHTETPIVAIDPNAPTRQLFATHPKDAG